MALALRCGPLRSFFLMLARSRAAERAGLVMGHESPAGPVCAGVVMVRNVSGEPDRFEMDPWGVVVAHQAAWNLGMDIVAVFHTHPCGQPRPSLLDLAGMRAWPMPWIISSPLGVRAWVLAGEGPREVKIL